MRNVIVTGASRGIGLAITERLSSQGYRVLAIARNNSEQLEELREKAKSTSIGAVEFRSLDLTDLAAIPELLRSLKHEFGPAYGLVNNAGAGKGGVLGVTMDRDIEALIRLNSISPIIISKYIVRSMMAAREGRIINIASIVALNGFNALSVYSATKASLQGFTRSLAREVGPFNVTVNTISPGFIDTDLTSVMSEADRSRIIGRSALRRLADPIDVARSVEFLLGDGGRNITGIDLTIDAGSTA